MNKKKLILRGIITGSLSILLLAALISLLFCARSSLLLVQCADPAAAQLIRSLDFTQAVYHFREEVSAALYTPWRSTTTPVTWINGDFTFFDGELLYGRWPENMEVGAVLLSEMQAAALFGTPDCVTRSVRAGNINGTVVGVYRSHQSLPEKLSQPNGAPAYVMTDENIDALLAVQILPEYDAPLAVSEITQQLSGRGIYSVQIENVALAAAQTKGHVQMLLAVVSSLYMIMCLRLLRPVQMKNKKQVCSVFQLDYLPGALRKSALPCFRWLIAWLLPGAGVCACVWLFLRGIVIDPQFLPSFMKSSAVQDSFRDFLTYLNAHRLSNTSCCNILLWTLRLAELCFTGLILLYLPWRKEVRCHAK